MMVNRGRLVPGATNPYTIVPDAVAKFFILTYSATVQKLKAERQRMRWSQVPQRMHFRGGYGQPGFGNKIWGLLVDAACAGIIIWVVSGLIMWWRLPRLRTWGTIAVAAGILSFTLLAGTL